MNKAIIIGNLTRDPELTQTKTGIPAVNVTVAVPRPFKKADGSRDTDFFRVVVYRQSAEYMAKFGRKGNKVAVEGQLLHREYTAQDGARHEVWELIAERCELYAPRDDVQREVEEPRQGQGQFEEVLDDELPF